MFLFALSESYVYILDMEIGHLLGYHNMDCMDLLRELPDNAVDLAIVDPPYGIGEDGAKSNSRKNSNPRRKAKGKNTRGTYIPPSFCNPKQWDSRPPKPQYFHELIRVSRHQIIWGANYYDYSFGPGRIIWDKVNDHSDQSDCEIAYCSLHKSTRIFRYMWAGMMQGKSRFEGTIQKGNKAKNEKRIHPTQKPADLYLWLLDNYAKPGQIILDTHVGSGSSLIACKKKGFQYIGTELDGGYYELSRARIAREKSGIEKRTFQEVLISGGQHSLFD